MKLESVDIQNFRSIGKVKLSLDNQGLILIQGVNMDKDDGSSNGAAKSSLYYAIIYALYGKTPKGTAGDDIVNNKIGKNTHCIVEFSHRGINYTVARYRKDKDNKNKVLLYRDGEEITKASNKLTDAYIVDIIGMNITTMLNSLVFGESSVNRFSEATDKERKEILEDITNIAIYKRALDIVKEDAATNKLNIDKANNELSSAVNHKDSMMQYIDRFKQEQKDYANQLAKAEETVTNCKKAIDTIGYTDEDLDNEEENYQNDLAVLQQKFDKANTVKSSTELNTKLSALASKVGQIDNQKKISKDNLDKAKQAYTELANASVPRCPHCGHKLDEEHRKQELERITNDGKQARASYDESTRMLLTAKKASDILNTKLSEIEKFNSSIKPKLELINKDINSVRDSLTEVFNRRNKLDSYKHDVVQAKQWLEELKQRAPKNNGDFESEEDLNKHIKEATDKVSKLEAKEKQFNDLKVVFSDKGVKSHVLDLVTPYLNSQANYYLSVLTNGTISVNISTQSESKAGNVSDKMSVEVSSVDGGSAYNELSTGEQKRVNLAISLSLQDYVLSKNPEINLNVFDEIFDGLDEDGIMQVMKLLKERNKNIGTILVISHNQALRDMFTNSITIKKKDGISYVD